MTRGSCVRLYPAQIRYQLNNPIVSFRLPKAEYDKLKEAAKNSGRSLAGVVRKYVREASQATAAHKRGYEDGFQAAKKDAETKLQQVREKGYEEGFQTAKRKLEASIKEAREKGYEDGFQTAKREFEQKIIEARKKGYEEGAKISKERRSKIIEAALKEGYNEGYKQAKSKYKII